MSWLHNAVEGLREGFRPATQEGVDVPASLKSTAQKAQIAALVIGVVAVAGAAFSLIGGILSGGVIFGILGTAACLLIALAARDVYVIAEKLANPSKWQVTEGFFRGLLAEARDQAPDQKIIEAAAKEGTFIIKPPLVRWVFETFING